MNKLQQKTSLPVLYRDYGLMLASALEKISVDSRIEAVNRHDVAQLFIDNPREKDLNNHLNSFFTFFATHPPIEKRIALLRQFQ